MSQYHWLVADKNVESKMDTSSHEGGSSSHSHSHEFRDGRPPVEGAHSHSHEFRDGRPPVEGEGKTISDMHLDICSFSVLKQRCPHLLQEATADKCTSAKMEDDGKSAKKTKGGKKSKKRKHDDGMEEEGDDGDGIDGVAELSTAAQFYKTAENIHAVPARHRLFQELFNRMPTVPYTEMGTGTDAIRTSAEHKTKLASTAFIDLPLSDAVHESSVLYQCGPRTFQMGGGADGSTVQRIVPGCILGTKCEGLCGEIAKSSDDPEDRPGWQLGMYMNPEQWKTFQESGTPPREPGRCLLDLRLQFCAAQVALMNDSLLCSSELIKTRLLAVLRNPVHGPGAYKQTETWRPPIVGEKWRGFIDPVVRHDRSKLVWEYDSKSHLWRIDQSALLAVAPSSSSSSNTDFRNGAVQA
jgi:hypothetical protein